MRAPRLPSAVGQDRVLSWLQTARSTYTARCPRSRRPLPGTGLLTSPALSLLLAEWRGVQRVGAAPPDPPACLHQVHAQLLEGLQQAGIPDLLDDEDTLWALVPRQPLAGRVLDVPGGEERSHQDWPRCLGAGRSRVADLPPAALPPGRASLGGHVPQATCCLNAPTAHLRP